MYNLAQLKAMSGKVISSEPLTTDDTFGGRTVSSLYTKDV